MTEAYIEWMVGMGTLGCVLMWLSAAWGLTYPAWGRAAERVAFVGMGFMSGFLLMLYFAFPVQP